MRQYLKKRWLKNHGSISFIKGIGTAETGRWSPSYVRAVYITHADSPIDGLYDDIKEELYKQCETCEYT